MADKHLEKAVSTIHQQFGPESLVRLGSNHHAQIEAISTGCLSLDTALGIGGVPRGRMVEIFGPESAGKTTLACHITASGQKAGPCAFIDAEHTFDPGYATAIGVDTENLYVSQPDNGEQALQIADHLLGEMEVIVIDSVAALTPRAEIEGLMGDVHVGLLARLMSQATRKFSNRIGKTKTSLVFTNQIREKVGQQGFGPVETQPGGRALRFHAAQRLDIRRIETLRANKESPPHGIKCKVKVVKNKTAPPYREAEFVIRYGEGISREDELLEAGLETGQIKLEGSYYKHDGSTLGQGRENAIAFLKDNPEFAGQLHSFQLAEGSDE